MRELTSRPPVDPRYAWLGLALPADARRFRTDDPNLAALLVDAGAELVTHAPDVEIAQPGGLRGDAKTAVVPFQPRAKGGGSRARRGTGRIVRGAALVLEKRRASRSMRRLGYATPHTIAWERSVAVVERGLPKIESRRVAHRWPMNAVAVAHRRDGAPTIFNDVVNAAGRATGQVVRPLRVVFGSSGVIVADLGSVILRLAVGPAAVRLGAQREAIRQLMALDPPPAIRRRVPRVTEHGEEGLAAWTLENRLPGDHPSQLDPDITTECADFLVELARLPVDGSPRNRLLSAAETITRECRDGMRDDVTQAAAIAIDELAELPCCFVHGDFWIGNLLTEGDRLSGIVDWSAGGPDGLPLIDALHLVLSSIREQTSEPLGLAVAVHLLSDQTPFDSKMLRDASERLGLELSAAEKHALVVAYWLEALARDLRDPDSVYERARWERENVVPVLAAMRGKSEVGNEWSRAMSSSS